MNLRIGDSIGGGPYAPNVSVFLPWCVTPRSYRVRMIGAVLRLARLGICLAGGFLAVAFFPLLAPAAREALIRHWARTLLWAIDVRLRVEGPLPAEPGLLVANHVSWLDVLALAAVQPAAFVCKSEIAAWPAIGWLLKRVGTVFIVRARRRDILRVNDARRARLAAGETVALFPEGTTTDGSLVLPFRPALFQPAVERGLSVYPAALSYSHPAAAFVGGMTFWSSLVAIAGAGGFEARLCFLPALCGAGVSRKLAAAATQAAVREEI